MNTPKDRIKAVIPHLLYAAEQAQKKSGGEPIKLGIVSKDKEGVTHLGASFFALEFLVDLQSLIDISDEEAEEGRLDASVTHFLQSHGLTVDKKEV